MKRQLFWETEQKEIKGPKLGCILHKYQGTVIITHHFIVALAVLAEKDFLSPNLLFSLFKKGFLNTKKGYLKMKKRFSQKKSFSTFLKTRI